MTDTGFVGLDPDGARDLGRLVGGVAETAGHIGAEVTATLALAQIADNGVAELCTEIDEELGLLRDFLAAKADEIELAAAGYHMSFSGSIGAALWASLTDGVGEGADLGADHDDETATVTLSSSVAAAALAEYLSWLDDDTLVDIGNLAELAADEDLPPEIRAAAQYFVLNREVWGQVLGMNHVASQEQFTAFVVGNAAIAQFARSYDRFDTAGQDADTDPDGTVSLKDVQIVAANENGEYTDEEQAAAQWLLDHQYPAGLFDDRRLLTDELYKRRIFDEDPALAVDYLQAAAADPGEFLYDGTWYDTEGGTAWLNAAVASTDDPAEQAEIVLTFASIYQATMPEPIGLLDIAHDLLDVVSFVDPTQIADALNTGIYLLEGDNVNAGIAAGGMLLPIGGGAVIRMTSDKLLALASHQGDEFAEAVLKQAVRNGELTDELVEKTVREVGEQFGPDAAHLVQKYLDDIRAAPVTLPTSSAELVVELAGTGVRHTPEDIIRIARAPSGQIVFLETGNATAGLTHIVTEHGAQFAGRGIAEGQLPDFLITAVTEGRVVGMQGTRQIFEVPFDGQVHRVAVSISDNGYIVGANPRSMP